MRNYFLFFPDSGGMIDSRELSIHIEHMPDIQRPTERVETIVILGRSGTLTKKQGENIYDSYTKAFDIVALDEGKIPAIHKLLRGSGKIIFSNEPQYRYTVSITEGWSFNRFFRQWRRATLAMETFPFKESSEEKISRGVQSTDLFRTYNRVKVRVVTDVPCPFFAEITKKTDGIFNLALNGKSVITSISSSAGKIYLDNERGLFYTEKGENLLQQGYLTTDFPLQLHEGENILEVSTLKSQEETFPNLKVTHRGWFL